MVHHINLMYAIRRMIHKTFTIYDSYVQDGPAMPLIKSMIASTLVFTLVTSAADPSSAKPVAFARSVPSFVRALTYKI